MTPNPKDLSEREASPPLDYAKLREIAERATCGEWEIGERAWEYVHVDFAGSGHSYTITSDNRNCPVAFTVGDEDGEAEANATFLATFAPPTVLTLLAENERMAKALTEIARLRTELRGDFSRASHQSDIARQALSTPSTDGEVA